MSGMAPCSPIAGASTIPRAIHTLGDALGVAEGPALGDALGDAEGLALGDADALGDGEACVTVMVVTPFWVVALTIAPDAPMRKMPEIAPAFA